MPIVTWEARWQAQRTPWDAGAPAPSLVELLAGRRLPVGRALVPGCGSGWDVFAFAEAGYEAVGLDVAPTAGTTFETLREVRGHSSTQAVIHVGDAFAHDPGPGYDVVWDYTFLCALDPSERQRWADFVATMLAPGGVLGTLIFPAMDVAEDYQGPPWPLFPAEVEALLAPRGFRADHLAPATASHPGREGMEHLGLWRRAG